MLMCIRLRDLNLTPRPESACCWANMVLTRRVTAPMILNVWKSSPAEMLFSMKPLCNEEETTVKYLEPEIEEELVIEHLLIWEVTWRDICTQAVRWRVNRTQSDCLWITFAQINTKQTKAATTWLWLQLNNKIPLTENKFSPNKAKLENAMEREMKSLCSNELVEPPPNRKIIGSKWNFKRKVNADGAMVCTRPDWLPKAVPWTRHN